MTFCLVSLESNLLHLNTLPLSTNKQDNYSFPPPHQTVSLHFSRSKNTHRHACTHLYTHPGRERVKSTTWVTHTPLPPYLHTGASAKSGTPPLQTHKHTHTHVPLPPPPLPSLLSSARLCFWRSALAQAPPATGCGMCESHVSNPQTVGKCCSLLNSPPLLPPSLSLSLAFSSGTLPATALPHVGRTQEMDGGGCQKRVAWNYDFRRTFSRQYPPPPHTIPPLLLLSSLPPSYSVFLMGTWTGPKE